MPAKEGIMMAKLGGLTQFAQSLIEYVEDLVTASPKKSFSKVEVLILLNAVKNDPEMLAMLDACDQSVRPPTYNE